MGMGMRMRGMKKDNSRVAEGMIYPPRRNEVPIPHKNFANLNTMHEYEVSIPVNRTYQPWTKCPQRNL